jgi:hypothetical protein
VSTVNDAIVLSHKEMEGLSSPPCLTPNRYMAQPSSQAISSRLSQEMSPQKAETRDDDSSGLTDLTKLPSYALFPENAPTCPIPWLRVRCHDAAGFSKMEKLSDKYGCMHAGLHI